MGPSGLRSRIRYIPDAVVVVVLRLVMGGFYKALLNRCVIIVWSRLDYAAWCQKWNTQSIAACGPAGNQLSEFNLLKCFIWIRSAIFLYKYMPTSSNEGGGASFGYTTLNDNSSCEYTASRKDGFKWWKSSCQVAKILSSVVKLRNHRSAKRPRKPGQK